jgi:hypothetical protein
VLSLRIVGRFDVGRLAWDPQLSQQQRSGIRHTHDGHGVPTEFLTLVGISLA